MSNLMANTATINRSKRDEVRAMLPDNKAGKMAFLIWQELLINAAPIDDWHVKMKGVEHKLKEGELMILSSSLIKELCLDKRRFVSYLRLLYKFNLIKIAEDKSRTFRGRLGDILLFVTICNYRCYSGKFEGERTFRGHLEDKSRTFSTPTNENHLDNQPLNNRNNINNIKKNTLSSDSYKKEAAKKGTLKRPVSRSSDRSDECDEVVKIWNESCGSLAKVKVLTKARRDKLVCRLKEQPDLGVWREALANLTKSRFIQDNGWCSFDWLVKNDTNFAKLAEGAYSDKARKDPRDEGYNCTHCHDNKRVLKEIPINGEMKKKIVPCPKCQDNVVNISR